MTVLHLKRGSIVRIHDAGITAEAEVFSVGAAGFRAKGIARTFWCSERGRAWSSDELDRADEAKRRRETTT